MARRSGIVVDVRRTVCDRAGRCLARFLNTPQGTQAVPQCHLRLREALHHAVPEIDQFDADGIADLAGMEEKGEDWMAVGNTAGVFDPSDENDPAGFAGDDDPALWVSRYSRERIAEMEVWMRERKAVGAAVATLP